MQISHILRQPAGMAMTKYINCWQHHAFEPFSQQIYLFWDWYGMRGLRFISIIVAASS